MDKTKAEALPELDVMIDAAKSRLFILVDFATMTAAEMRLNSSTLSWPLRIIQVLAENQRIIDDSNVEFQELLHQRRNQLIDELETMANQVRSFRFC